MPAEITLAEPLVTSKLERKVSTDIFRQASDTNYRTLYFLLVTIGLFAGFGKQVHCCLSSKFVPGKEIQNLYMIFPDLPV